MTKTKTSITVNFTESINNIDYSGNYNYSDKVLSSITFQILSNGVQLANFNTMGTTQNINFYNVVTPEQKKQIIVDIDTIITEINTDVIA